MSNIEVPVEKLKELLNEVKALRQEIEDLRSTRTVVTPGKPVFYSGEGRTKEERELQKREELLHSPEMERAVEAVIKSGSSRGK